MDKLREAAESALGALLYHTEQTRPIHSTNAAISALRAALAEQAPARVPLTEQQIVACITKADCHGGAMRMSYGSGPYEITRPTLNALAIVRAIERAHGIGAAP